MADEPRRSGRATKGQHKQDRDLPEDAVPKKKGRGKAAKATPTEEVEEDEADQEEVIRCVCGTYEEETDEPRAMIACDNCSAWQHNDCMGLAEDYQPESYFCEQCKPADHKELLASMARGEKPWEEAAAKREAAQEGKKKGKKGRKPAVKAEPQEQEEQTPAKGGQKRKAEETPVPELKNKRVRGTSVAENGTRAVSQSRKASTPARQATKAETDGAGGSLQDIANTARRGAAQNLVQLFVDQIKVAVKKGSYKLPSGSNAQDLGLQIGLQVEHALHGVLSQDDEPNDAYKSQLRAIIFNIKKNAELGLRVIKGGISPDKLVSMDPKDMASEEQQRKDAAIMKEMEKQHEIIEEQGPRIRRTHKGEEYVDEAHGVPAESSTSRAPRKVSAVDQKPDGKQTEGKTKQPLSVNTQAKPRSTADLRRKSSANFNIGKVFSDVQGSPDGETTRFPDIKQHGSPQPRTADNDPDIDNLLKDEENESEPYSPKEFSEEGIVWRGVVNGNSLGRFHTYAKHAAGTTPEADSLHLTWAQVIPSEIQIHGRIQPQKADEYLCGLESSQSSDLIVVAMSEPSEAQSADGFDRFFKYLKNKQRYGVGMQHEISAIKDIYLLPMDAGQALPTFMKALVTDFPDPVPERMLLVPIVIRNSELPHNLNAAGQLNIMSPSVGPGAVAQTPITPQEGQRDMLSQPPGIVPYQNPQNHGSNGHQIQQHNAYGGSQSPYIGAAHAQQQPVPAATNNSTPAAGAAMRVLGAEIAASPAVRELVAKAPTAGDGEMRVVRECIQENPHAAQNLAVLTMMLQARNSSNRPQAQAQAGQTASR